MFLRGLMFQGASTIKKANSVCDNSFVVRYRCHKEERDKMKSQAQSTPSKQFLKYNRKIVKTESKYIF